MRASVVLITTALVTITAAEVRAQDSGLPLDVDTARTASVEPVRVPAMIVQEAPLTKPETGKKDPVAPKPMVMRGSSGISNGTLDTTSGNPVYDKLIKESAVRHGIDPNLMVAVMRQESGFNPRAKSYKGATGLMQLMPATARRFGVTNIWDPAQNIEGGAKYLRFLLDTFNGDVKLVLAGYNAGENAVIGAGYRIPRYRETQNYVKSISARYGLDKHQAVRAKPEPKAPDAMAMVGGGGTSSTLSNNY
jgi:hypothetical protein